MSAYDKGLTITYGLIGSVTATPAEMPAPEAGCEITKRAVSRLMSRRGTPFKVEAVHTIILTTPNPSHADESFRENLFRVLDRNGHEMPDRQKRVVEHERISHPFELLLAPGRGAPERRYAFFATSFDAIMVGELWQRGLLDVCLEDLRIYRGGAPEKTAARP